MHIRRKCLQYPKQKRIFLFNTQVPELRSPEGNTAPSDFGVCIPLTSLSLFAVFHYVKHQHQATLALDPSQTHSYHTLPFCDLIFHVAPEACSCHLQFQAWAVHKRSSAGWERKLGSEAQRRMVWGRPLDLEGLEVGSRKCSRTCVPAVTQDFFL